MLQAAHTSLTTNVVSGVPIPAAQLDATQPPAAQPSAVPMQTPGQPPPPSAAQPQPSSQTPQAELAALSIQAQPRSGSTKNSEGSPAEGAEPKGGSPTAEEGLSSPSKQVKMMSGILEVLAREVLNPASTKETRDAAHTCLQVLSMVKRKEKKRLDYTLRREFDEMPDNILGCPEHGHTAKTAHMTAQAWSHILAHSLCSTACPNWLDYISTHQS